MRRRAPVMRVRRDPGPVAADVLESLVRLGPSTVAVLSEDTGRSRARVQDALDRLWRRRLVRRGPWRALGGHRGSAPRVWRAAQ